MRQWVESVINTLKEQLGLEQHRGRTLGGVFVRVGQRLLAMAAAIWFNWRSTSPTSGPCSPMTIEPLTIQSESTI